MPVSSELHVGAINSSILLQEVDLKFYPDARKNNVRSAKKPELSSSNEETRGQPGIHVGQGILYERAGRLHTM